MDTIVTQEILSEGYEKKTLVNEGYYKTLCTIEILRESYEDQIPCYDGGVCVGYKPHIVPAKKIQKIKKIWVKPVYKYEQIAPVFQTITKITVVKNAEVKTITYDCNY